MRVKLRLSVLALILLSQSVQAAAPDICAYDNLKVAVLRGRVAYEPSQVGTEAAANAIVELRRAGYNGRVIARVVADKDGRFDFGKVKDGKYVIYVEAPKKISSIYFPIELNKPRQPEGDESEIKGTLGSGYKGCRGSFAQYGEVKTLNPKDQGRSNNGMQRTRATAILSC
jgi:hypothetical protein